MARLSSDQKFPILGPGKTRDGLLVGVDDVTLLVRPEVQQHHHTTSWVGENTCNITLIIVRGKVEIEEQTKFGNDNFKTNE